MREIVGYSLLMILLMLCCACEASKEDIDMNNKESTITEKSESIEVNYIPTERTDIERFSLEDFSNIIVGESIESALDSIASQCVGYQTAYGCVYDFSLEDGQYLWIVCRAGVVQSIEIHNTPFISS